MSCPPNKANSNLVKALEAAGHTQPTASFYYFKPYVYM